MSSPWASGSSTTRRSAWRPPSKCTPQPTGASRSTRSSGTARCAARERSPRSARRCLPRPPRTSDRLKVSAGQQQVLHSAARPRSTRPRPKARSGSRSTIAVRSRASTRQPARSRRSSRSATRRPSSISSPTPTGSLPARQASGSPTLPGARSGESIRRRTRLPSRSRCRSSRTCWPSTERLFG